MTLLLLVGQGTGTPGIAIQVDLPARLSIDQPIAAVTVDPNATACTLDESQF